MAPRPRPTHIDDPAAVGRRLAEARAAAGLSQRGLAFPGCTAAYISRVEAGERAPSERVLRELGRRLGVSADWLAKGRERPGVPLLAEAELTLRLDEPAQARQLYERAAETAEDPETRARALAGLGHIAFDGGDHEEAIGWFQQALAAWPTLEEDPSLADSLGRAYAHTSRHEAAIALFQRRLAAAEAKQELLETVRFAVLLANTLVDSGRFGRAEELLGHALALTHDLRDPIVQARLWWSQSRLHALKKNPTLAERYARMALDALLLTEHVRYSALAHQVLAHIKLDKGEPEEALELLERGLPLIRQGGNAYEEAEFTLERARALLAMARPRQAADLAQEAADQMLPNSPIDAGRALAVLGEAHEQLDEAELAIEAYEQAAELLQVDDRYRLEVHAKLAGLLRALGRTSEALDVLERAVAPALQRQRHTAS
jgi:tetratricopeptide (TPR) repeat protein